MKNKFEVVKYTIVFLIFALLAYAFWTDYNVSPSEYVPRIKQQQAFKMIKEIHEHLLGE
jgi:hypothetical protein